MVVVATLTARLIEARSIYDARLSDEEVRERQRQRERRTRLTGRVARHGAGDQARKNGSGRERRESPVVTQENEAAPGIFDGQL